METHSAASLPSRDLNIQSSLRSTMHVEISGHEEGGVALTGEDVRGNGLFLRRTTKWSRGDPPTLCGLKQASHTVPCMAGVKRTRRTRV